LRTVSFLVLRNMACFTVPFNFWLTIWKDMVHFLHQTYRPKCQFQSLQGNTP
jgi:hypothetical protein